MVFRNIKIDDDDWNNLEKEAKKNGYNSRTEFIGKLVKNFLTGGSNSQLTVKQEIEQEKLKKIQFENQEIKEIKKRKLEAETKITEYHANHLDVIGSKPSKQAEQAIRIYTENREFTKSEYENVLKYITLKNHNFKWQATCDICKDGETYDTRYDAIHDMIRHLTTEHAKKVMEMK